MVLDVTNYQLSEYWSYNTKSYVRLRFLCESLQSKTGVMFAFTCYKNSADILKESFILLLQFTIKKALFYQSFNLRWFREIP